MLNLTVNSSCQWERAKVTFFGYVLAQWVLITERARSIPLARPVAVWLPDLDSNQEPSD
jgi:hypothetical protein